MTVRQTFGLAKTEGEVGIEIEVEGDHLTQGAGPLWRKEMDGSLNGNSAEYVLNLPCTRESVGESLSVLDKALKKSHTKVHESERTGVHVHINVQEMTMPQVFSFLILYGVFEDMLINYCGENRSGNLFCLGMKDAEYLPYWIRQCCPKKQWGYLPNADVRYGAINLEALKKYGSLEFRAMRGTVDMEILENWTKILLRIKDFSIKVKNPVDIITMVSLQGENGFARKVFGEDLDLLWTQGQDWSKSIREGMRRMQPIAYEVEIPTVKKRLNKAKAKYVDNEPLKNIMAQFNKHMQGQ